MNPAEPSSPNPKKDEGPTISSRYFGGAFTITFDDLEFPEYDGEQPQPSTSVGVHLGAAALEHAVLDAPAVGGAHYQVVI